MFSKKRVHELPSFPKEIKKVFKSYCNDVPDDEYIEKLKGFVKKEVQNAKQREEEGSVVDVKLAEEIAKRCLYLLNNFDFFPPKMKRLIIGATCYFAVSEDPLSEEIFASGYNDDAKVLNYVLEEVGINDMFIDIEETSVPLF